MQPNSDTSPVRFGTTLNAHSIELTNKVITADKLAEVLRTHKSIIDITQRCRAIIDLQEAQAFARQSMPCIMGSGVFAGGYQSEHLQRHSGVTWLHINVQPERLKTLQNELQTDKYVSLFFIDVTGKELWVAFRVNYRQPADQQAFFSQLSDYCRDTYELADVEIDTGGASLTHRVPLSHDPDAYVNLTSEAMVLLDEYKTPTAERIEPDTTKTQGIPAEPIAPVSESRTGQDNIMSQLQAELHRAEQEAKQQTSESSEKAHKDSSTGTINEKLNVGLLIVRTANSWINEAKNMAIPKMLFDEFWLEGEICFLFAEANQGKSILAVQIADSVSRGLPMKGFRMEAKAQPILYFDFELTAKQFEKRYSVEYKDHYQWDDNFKRIEINPDADPPDGVPFEDFLNQSIEQAIIQTKSKVLIIDNITFLQTETEKAKDASLLMKYLKALKNKYGLSLLVLAHCPKRDASRPLGRNDLQGSARLNQFADSMFAIGASAKDSQLKYLKQVKVRSAAYNYDAENVAVCQIYQPGNFVMLEMMRFSSEHEHLKELAEKESVNVTDLVLELHRKGRTQTEIAHELGVSQPTVGRKIKAASNPNK